MKKYLAVARITTINILRYRWEIILGQIRTIIVLLTLFYLWTKVYSTNVTLFNFTKEQMLTYIVIATVLRQIITVSATDQIAGELQSWGKFFSYLLKPIGYFRYWFTVDLVYKITNLVLTSIWALLFLKIFKISLILPTDPRSLFIFLLAIAVGALIYFYIGIIISTTGFWTSHIWGLQFLTVLILEFSAGVYFPIDVLPDHLEQVIKFTPFPYMIYFPIKIYLGHLSLDQSLIIVAIAAIWLVIIFFASKFIWNRGLKSYEAWGG